MLLSKYLDPFILYNFLLIFLFSLSINAIESFPIINSVSYIFLQYVIIYLGLYYYCKKLYMVCFLYGLGIDLFLIDQIGTHLLVFMRFPIFYSIIQWLIPNSLFYSFPLILDNLYIYIVMFISLILLLFASLYPSIKSANIDIIQSISLKR